MCLAGCFHFYAVQDFHSNPQYHTYRLEFGKALVNLVRMKLNENKYCPGNNDLQVIEIVVIICWNITLSTLRDNTLHNKDLVLSNKYPPLRGLFANGAQKCSRPHQ